MAIPNQLGNNDGKTAPDDGRNTSLVSYISPRIERARDVRDEQYGQRWDEYTRLWRGFWDSSDKTTNSERSRLISPALSQAIEMTTAEIEEATFGRIAWFDIKDDIADEEKDDAVLYRDQLLEDFELARVQSQANQIFLLGSIYGTGIGKLNVIERTIQQAVKGTTQTTKRILVTLEPIRPDEFLIDPAATSTDEAEFCAHEIIKPIHTIKEKQRLGLYTKGPVTAWSDDGQGPDPSGTGHTRNIDSMDNGVLITEYFGRVPANLLDGPTTGTTPVEAIVVLANRSTVLRAVESPFTNKDRPIIAYQHEKIPGEFWGRGVAEKGYNPQKGLDGEIRSRMDALALIGAPMMGADMTRMPRNPDMRTRPGKVWLTNGRPSEVLEQVGFSAQGLALSFQQSGDFERMVQMGTGAMDTATPNNISRRNETNGGMSQMQSGFLKRAKRTMSNIEQTFLDPLIRRSLWRYMQFDPERYPTDQTFVVHSTMGLQAREVENAQLVQMLGFTPPESPAHKIILTALFENTNSSEKGDLKKAVEAMTAPPSPEQQQMAQQEQQLKMKAMAAEVQRAELENKKLEAEIMKLQAETQFTAVKADLEDDKVQIDAANSAINAENARNRARDIDVKRATAQSKNGT